MIITLISIIAIYTIIKYITANINKYKKNTYITNITKSITTYNTKHLPFITKISNVICDAGIIFKIKNINIISTLSILIISFIIFLLTFILIHNYLNIIFSSLILSLFVSLIPYYIIKYISYNRKIKIINLFPNYIISLKNYTDVNNDIIEAFKRTTVEEPLSKYIDKFNVSIQKGVKIYDAFEVLKNDIKIRKINQFITLIQFCYLYGGNYGELIDKFSKIQMKTNSQREKEKQKIFSAKFALITLIILNVYVLFGFVLPSPTYYDILVNTFIGNMILNINILSYIIIFYMYIKLNKMEE